MKVFCIADIHGGYIDFTGAGQCDWGRLAHGRYTSQQCKVLYA